MPELLANYHPALLSLGVMVLAVTIQGQLTGVAFSKGVEHPGMPLKGGPEDSAFRMIRTYQNSVETLPAFIGALLLAILVGVSAFWVNILAAVYVVLRLAYWAVYYSPLGIKTPSYRTFTFIFSALANIALAVLAIISIAFGAA